MTDTSVPLRAPVVEAPGVVARGRELSTAAWLAGIVLVSTAVRFVFAAAVPAPAVFPDELLYAELARGVGSSGEFLVRDVPFSAWTFGPLYVALIAPAFLLSSLPDAYIAVKAVNCLVMSLAAVPAFFIARRIMDDRLARLAAVLSVLLPGMAFSARVMTESLFYPLFLLAVLASLRVLEEPRLGRQLSALAAIGLASGARVQAAVLLPALLTAICANVVFELQANRGLSLHAAAQRLKAYRATALMLVAAGVVLMASGEIAGDAASSGWERLEYVASRVSLPDVPRWLTYHLAELVLAVAIVPLAAAVLLIWSLLSDRASTRGEKAFAAVTVSVAAWMVLLTGVFASQPDVARIQERYLFYLEALVLIAFLGWLGRGSPRPSRAAVVAACAVALLPLVLPYGDLLNYHVFASTPGLVPLVLVDDLAGAGATLGLVAALGLAACLVVTKAPRPRLALAPVAVYLTLAALLVNTAFQTVSMRALAAGGADHGRTWIDDAAGADADVAVLWSGTGRSWLRDRKVWESEFFNRSVGPVYYLDRAPAYDLPQTRVRLRRGVVVTVGGRTVRADYVLSDGPVISGATVARRPGAGLTLYRVDGAVRVVAGGADR